MWIIFELIFPLCHIIVSKHSDTIVHNVEFIIQGFTWTLIRNVPTYGIFFAINSYLADRFLTSMNKSAALLLAGGLTGIVSWTAAFPSDTLKSRD